MGSNMETRKIVILATALVASLSFGGAVLYHSLEGPDPIAINIQGLPTIGQGEIVLVIFEDFRCMNCRIFNEKIFPQIVSRYIETGRVRYAFVPLAFMEGSKPLASAALNVYDQSPDRFLLFIHELFSSQANTRNEILRVAQRVGGIDLHNLSRAIDLHLYHDVLEKNLNWAKTLMGRQFGTPALFINGIATSTASFEAVEQRIQQVQKRR